MTPSVLAALAPEPALLVSDDPPQPAITPPPMSAAVSAIAPDRLNLDARIIFTSIKTVFSIFFMGNVRFSL